MYDKDKRPASRGTRKRVTAKSVHNNLKIDFFSNNIEPSVDEKPARSPKKRKRTSLVRRRRHLGTILGNKREYNKIREDSNRFYDRFANYGAGPDPSQLVVVNGETLEELVRSSESRGESLVPIVSHSNVSSYGLIVIKPGSKCGPLINTLGIMVLVFIEVEDNKVFFESSNSIERKRTPCQNRIQILVIPDEAFVIYNESAERTARLLAISCKKKWKDFSDLKDKKAVPLASM